MTPDERKMLADLFDRVQSAAANRRDPEAEAFIADNIRHQPYAPYLLAQAVIVQDEGLKNAASRIEQLERELAEARAQPAGGGSFLGSMFGGSSARAPEPVPQRQPQGSPWGNQRGGSVPSVGAQQSGGWGGQPMQQQPMQPAPQGGSFLKGALGTAAGVAGGMMLANSLSGLFSGQNNKHGIAGDNAGASSGAGSSLASHDDSAIAGGIFDDKSSGRSAQPEAQPVSYDDGGGWGSGGDDSYDA